MNVHQNARLTPHSRADLVRRVVVEGQTPKAVAAAFGVTAKALVGFRGVGSASCYQGGDERAEQGFAATAWVVHDLEEADFADKTLGKVAPYGIYDPVDNHGWVSLGIDHDTAEFAVNAIRTWHERIGSVRYRGSDRLLITADCGGSNGARVRLWKVELQKLADETGLTISACHYPPGTSKWNTIEHRMFCHITQNW